MRAIMFEKIISSVLANNDWREWQTVPVTAESPEMLEAINEYSGSKSYRFKMGDTVNIRVPIPFLPLGQGISNEDMAEYLKRLSTQLTDYSDNPQ